jgi:uncharacterized membrane protein
MTNDLVLEGKTKTGALDFKLAAAACYLPVSFIHLVAAGVFLATEPKEHRFVRFHAVQSLILAAIFLGGSIGTILLGMVVFPLILMVVGGVVGAALSSISEDLGGLVILACTALSAVSYLGGAVLGIALSLGFMPSFLVTAGLVMTGKVGRWPVIGGLAERFTG